MLIEEILPTTLSEALSRESDLLKSALIVCFEEAVERGLPPHVAIATILEWAAGECARLNESGT